METIIILLYVIIFNLVLLTLRAYFRPMVFLGEQLLEIPIFLYKLLLIQIFRFLMFLERKRRKKIYEKLHSER